MLRLTIANANANTVSNNNGTYPVSLAEANDAVEKLMAFVSVQPDGYLTEQQSNLLFGLRRALWVSEHQGTLLSPAQMDAMDALVTRASQGAILSVR